MNSHMASLIRPAAKQGLLVQSPAETKDLIGTALTRISTRQPKSGSPFISLRKSPFAVQPAGG
jgi:hypothetical protein